MRNLWQPQDENVRPKVRWFSHPFIMLVDAEVAYQKSYVKNGNPNEDNKELFELVHASLLSSAEWKTLERGCLSSQVWREGGKVRVMWKSHHETPPNPHHHVPSRGRARHG